MESCNHSVQSHKFWTILNHLSGKKARADLNQPICFGNSYFPENKEIANQFSIQFTRLALDSHSSFAKFAESSGPFACVIH